MSSDPQPADSQRGSAGHDPYAALRLPALRRYLAGNFLAILGMQMQACALGWEVFERTGSNLHLGLIGLAQVAPVLFLALLAGHVADRFNRKYVVMVALVAMATASLLLASASYWQWPLWTMYAPLVLIGTARAFQQPAKSSLLPQLVPADRFPNAVTWSTGSFHLASVLGPAVGGLVLHLSRLPSAIYLFQALAAGVFLVVLGGVRHRPAPRAAEELSAASLLAGVRFLRQSPIVLGAISLDLFAVLLGGATALLPSFAKQILHVGPAGLGWLQAALPLGAVLMAGVLAHRPPVERAGRSLLAAVAGFGVATIVFGCSRNYWLSLTALLVAGALDNVSVVIRHSLVQLLTPDTMRGRVSAVNGMFISASNELGAFESGIVAAWTGPTFSVVSGGVGTLVVVLAIALYFPQLRQYGRLLSGRA